MYTKLIMIGHVHGAPDRVITHYLSVPQGFCAEDVANKVESFKKAFTFKELYRL